MSVLPLLMPDAYVFEWFLFSIKNSSISHISLRDIEVARVDGVCSQNWSGY